LKKGFHSENASNLFPSKLRQKNLKKQQPAVILEFCLRKTRAGKSQDYGAVIVSKSSLLSGLFVSVQMFFTNIFPYLSFLNQFKSNAAQSIKPMNYVYRV